MKFSKPVAIASAVCGILLFSTKAVLVKLAYQYEIDTVTLLLLRMGFSLPVYLIIAFLKKPKETPKTVHYGWLIILGLIGYYLASYLDFLGLKYIKASLERLILFTYPAMVLVFSYLFFKEKVSSKQILGVLLTYLGIFLIFVMELSHTSHKELITGSLLVFLSAMVYAGYVVGSGKLIPRVGAVVFTSYAMIISCVAVIVHYTVSSPINIFRLDPQVYLLGLLMAVFATVLPSYLISFGIKGLGANNFSIYGSLGPVSTVGLAVIFLGESLTLMQFIGASVVIFGIYLSDR